MNFYQKLKLISRTLLNGLLYYSRANDIYLKLKEKNITFLAYHDISNRDYLFLQVPPDTFEEHIKYLLKHYKIISLKDAVRLLNNLEPINDNYVVITFDDGYKSVYTTAYPILKKYNVPFTIFLTTESIDTGIPPFVDCLAFAIQKTSKSNIDLTSYGLKNYTLKNPIQKELAIFEINSYSKSLPSKERKEFLHTIFNLLNVKETEELKNIMLSWMEIIELSSDNLVEFGAHTHTHPSLSKVPLNVARDEILYSKKKIETIINKEVSCFAYPYGTSDDINQDVINLVSRCGFSCAFTLSSSDSNTVNLFNIPRVCIVSPYRSSYFKLFSIPYFATTVSGFYDLLKNNKQKKSLKVFNINPITNTDKLKIFYFIDNLYLTAGTERHLTYLANHLDKDRFYPVICAFKASDDAIKSFQKSGIAFINLDLDRIYNFSAIKTFFYLRKILQRLSPDIVQTFHFKSDTYGVLAAKSAGVKCIISSRRDTGDLKKPRQILLNKFANKFIDRFIMVCDKVGESFHRLEGIPYEKMVTLYNGVDTARFNSSNGVNPINLRKELGFGENDFIVGTTAIFRPEKAYHIFFEGIEKVYPKIKNLKVLVCGDGPTKNHFVKYCSQRPIGKIVKFMGYVNNTEKYLPLMDVFCLVPNKNEGFSNAILEAMAMARPVIATDVGGNAEAVIHGETGIIIPPDNSDALAEAIMALYKDPEKRLQMGLNARERVLDVFSLERMIKEHEKFYESLLNKN